MRRGRLWGAVFAAGLMSGCLLEPAERADGLDGAENADEGKADQPGGSGTELPTRAESVAVLGGYHGLFDRVRSTCVETTSSAPVVGSTHERYELKFVSSREDLAQELGVDLRLKARYAGFEGEGQLETLRTVSTSATTVNVLLTLEQDYSVTEQGAKRLNAVGQDALAAGTQAFASTCGANYVDTVRYASTLQLLVTIEAESANVANEIKLGLDVDTPAGVPVDGGVKTRLKNATERADVEVHVQAIASGFEFDSTLSDLGKDGIDNATFQAIENIRGDMQSSRESDMQYDICRAHGGGSGCTGLRHSVPVGVKLGFYGDLPGVNADATFQRIRDHWSEVEEISASLSRAHERLEVAHAEARDFLTAIEQGAFNVVAPGVPLTTAALRDLASDRKVDLDPADVHSVTGRVFGTLEACWGRAADDLNYTCGDLAWGSVVDMAEEELAHYSSQARVLPLDMVAVDARSPWWEFWSGTDPEAACREITPRGHYRLPRGHELDLVAPMVSDGRIDWGSAEANAIWYDHDAACPEGLRPYFRNDGSGEPTLGCESKADFITTALCVPAGGPQMPTTPI